jgi:ribosome-associated protein
MLTGLQIKNILRECEFKTSRSGGKGGQNVNKLETKVEIEFDLLKSNALSARDKEIIFLKLPALQENAIIQLVSSRHRTQLENKTEVKKKLIDLINKGLKPVKKRRATKPSKASKEKKLESKKKRGEIKNLRKKLF